MYDILLTGASGFLGKVLLQRFGGEVHTIGRNNADFICDLAEQVPGLIKPYSLVIHAAGKAHSIPKSTAEKQEFFEVNVKGSQNLLMGLEKSAPPKSIVFISTVAVYGKTEGWLINENDPLRAEDAYGKSKIQAEQIIQEWCVKNNVICTILRLPLLVGPNPPGNLSSMITGINKGYYVNIAAGQAKKSMVLAEDVARIIPTAAEVGGIYNLTDGYHPSFAELSELIAKQLGKRKPVSIPGWLATLIAKTGDLIGPNAPITSAKLNKITSDLTFDDSKARKMLGWNPTPILEGFKIS